MSAAFTEFKVQLINARTQSPIDDDSGICNILTAGSPGEVTIYSDDSGTSASNPLTMTNGEILFYTDSATSTVDLSILTSTGQSTFVESLTTSQHRVEIDTEKVEQTLIMPILTLTASEEISHDTGFNIPDGAIVKDCYFYVSTTMTAVYSIGTCGLSDAFINAMTGNVTGYKLPNVTTLSDGVAFISANLLGGKLVKYAIGNTSVTDCQGDNGVFARIQSLYTTGISSITWMNDTATVAVGNAGSGYIFLKYDIGKVYGN